MSSLIGWVGLNYTTPIGDNSLRVIFDSNRKSQCKQLVAFPWRGQATTRIWTSWHVPNVERHYLYIISRGSNTIIQQPNGVRVYIPHTLAMINEMLLLETSERKFYKACDSIRILDQSIADVKIRFKKSKAGSAVACRINHQTRLLTLEGIRKMYLDYAHVQALRISDLTIQIFRQMRRRFE